MDFNTENTSTDYQTWTQYHVDLTVAQHFPFFGLGIMGIVANAFYYQQITGDSGSGTTLGNFKGRTVGIDPALSFVTQVGNSPLAFELKWLKELDVNNRLEGDYLWFKVAMSF